MSGSYRTRNQKWHAILSIQSGTQSCQSKVAHNLVNPKWHTILSIQSGTQSCQSKVAHNLVNPKWHTILSIQSGTQSCQSKVAHNLVNTKWYTIFSIQSGTQSCQSKVAHNLVNPKWHNRVNPLQHNVSPQPASGQYGACSDMERLEESLLMKKRIGSPGDNWNNFMFANHCPSTNISPVWHQRWRFTWKVEKFILLNYNNKFWSI